MSTYSVKNIEVNNRVFLSDGSVGTPSIAFSNDPDTGIYRPAANQLGFSINGAIMGRFVTNSGVASFAGQDGTVARPGIGFFGDLDTGIFRPTTNQVGIAAGGATSAIFGSTGVQLLDGSSATPSISFINDPDTGIYRNGSNDMAVSAGGTLVTRFASTAIVNSVPVRISNGTASSPGLVFSNDLDTGIFTPVSGGDKIGIISGGTTSVIFGGVTNSIATRTYFEKGVHHYPVVNSSVSGTYQVDMSASNIFNLTLTGNATISTTNDAIGSYFLYIRQDGTGGRTLQMHADGRFLGATAVSIGTASNAISVIQLVCIGTQSVVTSQRNITTL